MLAFRIVGRSSRRRTVNTNILCNVFVLCSQLFGDGPLLLSMFKLFTSVVMPQGVTASARSISTCGGPLWFRSSAPLFAEPLKKKKRLDPQILKAREDRKRKKVEKAIRRLEKVVKVHRY